MIKRIKIESRQINLRIVENTIDEVAGEIGLKQDNYGKILVSSLEAVNNAILHGNNSNPDKFVKIAIQFLNNELKIKVTDEGRGFKPGEIPDPTVRERLEEINGRGVFLMTKLADNIKFSKKGNSVTMIFKNIID